MGFFTIKEVRQEYGVMVAGRKVDFNIAYFVENIKPMVLNAGNSKIVKALAGGSSFIKDWDKNISVQLYIDPKAKMKGEVVGGVRIYPQKPKLQKPELTSADEKWWEGAIVAFMRDGNFDEIEKHATISDKNKAIIQEESIARLDEAGSHVD